MPRAKTCTGKVLIDKRDGFGRPFEILTVHFEDGGAAVTIADVLAKLGIAVKAKDRIRISVSVLGKARPKR
jgi:hypothetical protein